MESANASMVFQLESGDLELGDARGTAKPLCLQQAKAQLNIVNNQLDLVWILKGQELGYFDGQVTTAMTKVDSGFSLMANAPLSLLSNAQLNTIA